ncbi:MAG: VOC family protein [Geminicoccaceae bacterium]
MPRQVTPFLMFEGQAEEAMTFYVSVVPNSSVIDVQRYGEDGQAPEGTVMKGEFSIGGQRVLCTDSFVKHDFTFTPASSLFVDCSSEEELDMLVAELGTKGKVLMPPGDYGFSRKFAWLNDRFGVSWQLNLQ